MDDNQYQGTFEALLREFSEHVGTEELQCSEEGVCTIYAENDLLLNLFVNPNDGQLILWIPLPELPVGERTNTMAALLRANLFWQQTHGATISMLPDAEILVLVRQDPIKSVDVQRLEELISSMLETALELRPLFGLRSEIPETTDLEQESEEFDYRIRV